MVYAVVYSVLLLNTDLHVAQGNYSRMTRQEFIRNTMAAVHDQQSVCIEIEKGSPEFTREWEVEVEGYLKVKIKRNILFLLWNNENKQKTKKKKKK